jgi:fructan beta-fructosidase
MKTAFALPLRPAPSFRQTSLLLLVLAAVPLAAAEDLVIADFEAETYGAWQVTGEAFGPGPARGTLPGQMPVDGFKGQRLVNSFFQGDKTTGTLTSPPFKLQRKYLRFLIGGGKDLEKTCMNLLVDGRIVRQATGPNDRSGGAETLQPDSWEVSDWMGKEAVLQIVDRATGGWGHINIDQIVLTDQKPPQMRTNVQRDFRITRRYLHIPIKTGAPKRQVTTQVDDRVVTRNEMELALGTPDWWAPMDVSAWMGKVVTLVVEKLPEDATALSSIEPGDALRDAENLYREPLRGQFHFSPRRGWNNDPNGMVYFKGEYHLFFQHNPYGWAWGNMHWGHAVSRDLVHWEELGDKLLPDEMGPMFSGSAVVDWRNTSGLGRPGNPAQVLFYTAAGNPTVQCLAAGTDGRTFTKYSGNPILKQITAGNRDPKVLWHEPTQRWVMTLYVETNKVHSIYFFTSTNLKEWSATSVTDGFFECPDFFELSVDGDAGRRKWVLTAASSEYMVGSFDGKRFTPETKKLKGHQGRGFYAAQTFSDIPDSDGRRIQMGWFQTETKGMPFNQSMTLPLELKLLGTTEGPRLSWSPVKELETLRRRSHQLDGTIVTPDGPNPLAQAKAELVELRAEFEPATAREVSFTVRGASLVYDVAKQELLVNKQRVSAPLRQGRQRLIVYCDRIGLEIFASDGLAYVPLPFQPAAGDEALAIRATGAPVKFSSLQVHELKSAWPAAR